MKIKILIIGTIIALSSLNCKKKEKNVLQEISSKSLQIEKYKMVSELENLSFSSILYRKKNINYKLTFKDSLGHELISYKFNSKKELKEIYSCDYIANNNQKLIFILDKNDSLFKAWSILNKKVFEFKIKPKCVDYEPEESFE